MDLAFFSPTDRVRAELTLRKIAMFDVSRWAITGGLAIEIHLYQHAAKSFIRPLQDIDFMTASFDKIPNGLAKDLLFRHIHPHDPPGRNLLQGVDPVTNVRVDVFRAYGLEMERVAPVARRGDDASNGFAQRHDRPACPLELGFAGRQFVAPEPARDFLRMMTTSVPARRNGEHLARTSETPTAAKLWRNCHAVASGNCDAL